MGDPVFPLTEPGAAVSPGTSNCSFTKEPALTLMDELVLAVRVPSVMSLAVTVRAPELFSVTLKVWLPLTSAALLGNTALASDDVIPILSDALAIKFQFASTALTTTLNGRAAVADAAVPVLPLAVPGDALSPGTRV